MVLDGVLAHEEAHGEVTVRGYACDQQLQHVLLPVGERLTSWF